MSDFYALRPSQCDDALAFLTERAQAEADARADAEYERYSTAESLVTFAEVIEELAGVNDATQADFMEALSQADRLSISEIFHMLCKARDCAIARRLAEGN